MSEPIEHMLANLASSQEAPAPLPPNTELAALLDNPVPVTPRRPRLELAIMSLAALTYAAGLVVICSVRRDIGELPLGWFIAYGALWLLAFVGIGWVAVVPAVGSVLVRQRLAGHLAVFVSIAFIVLGLFWTKTAPTSQVYAPTPSSVWNFATYCFGVGFVAALVPGCLFALALRRALPVGGHWVGAAIGAAGGSLSGLVLHIHCSIAEAWHVGLAHGGIVVITTLLGAVLTPQLTRS